MSGCGGAGFYFILFFVSQKEKIRVAPGDWINKFFWEALL